MKTDRIIGNCCDVYQSFEYIYKFLVFIGFKKIRYRDRRKREQRHCTESGKDWHIHTQGLDWQSEHESPEKGLFFVFELNCLIRVGKLNLLPLNSYGRLVFLDAASLWLSL